MASSGWQGEQTVYNYSSNVWLTGDLRIDGITHSGSTLRVWGAIELGGRGSSGYYVYFNNGVMGRSEKQSEALIVGQGVSIYAGQNYRRSFDVTINNVSSSATSYTFSAYYYACNANDCSSKYFDVRLDWNITFSASGDLPSGADAVFASHTWNSVTMTSSVSSWGSGYSGTPNLECIIDGGTTSSFGPRIGIRNATTATSVTNTVSNATKTFSLDGGLDLKGCTQYRIACWASTNIGNNSIIDSTTRYTPPAPGQLSYTDEGNSSWRVVYTGVAANNSTSYTAADLVRTFRYKDATDANWTYVQQDAQAAITDVTISYIPISPQHTVEIEAWMTYKGEQSEVSSTTITNDTTVAHLYGSVPGQVRNESAEIEKLYGSVNGQTKKITKLYASVGGMTKLIFEDNS